MTAIIFLELNDVELDVKEDELADIVIAAAQSQVDESELAEFFRSHTH